MSPENYLTDMSGHKTIIRPGLKSQNAYSKCGTAELERGLWVVSDPGWVSAGPRPMTRLSWGGGGASASMQIRSPVEPRDDLIMISLMIIRSRM